MKNSINIQITQVDFIRMFNTLAPTKSLQGYSSRGINSLIIGAQNPEIEKGNVPKLSKRYRVVDSLSLPIHEHEDLATDTAYNNNPFSVNLIGVVHLDNSNLKSQMFKKGVSFQRGSIMGPKLERRLYG